MKKRMIGCLLLVALGCYVMKEGIWSLFNEKHFMSDHKTSQITLDLYSNYAVLTRKQDGKILYQKHAQERMHPASLTKIMTVYLAIQHVEDLQRTIIVPSDIFHPLEEENASMAGFMPMEEVTIEDLLYGALLSSGADACVTLAQAISGSEAAFVELMNEEAKRIGMKDTHFENCTGLDQDHHYSTVMDIELLLQEALQHKTFETLFYAKSYVMTPNRIHPDGWMVYSTMRQTMELHGLRDSHILGGKTGYTYRAGLCLASQGEVDGVQYIFVSAGADGDAETQPYHILDAIKAYDTIAGS